MDALSRLQFSQPSSSPEIINDSKTCLVCYEIIHPHDVILDLTCKHTYHTGCVQSIMKLPLHKKNCPYCRAPMKELAHCQDSTVSQNIQPVNWEEASQLVTPMNVYIHGNSSYNGCCGKIKNPQKDIRAVRVMVEFQNLGLSRMINKKFIYSF